MVIGRYLVFCCFISFLFKQKTAYEMRISDWSSDVCSSDLKMHMFDVALASGESWRESAAYAAGEDVVSCDSPLGLLGLTICYDLRFPALFEALGNHRCDAIAIPAAFPVPTGRDHWHVLLRARAIEEIGRAHV